MIDPVNKTSFACYNQSFMIYFGEIASLVDMVIPGEYELEVHLISYNQADNTITTIQNFGDAWFPQPKDSSDEEGS